MAEQTEKDKSSDKNNSYFMAMINLDQGISLPKMDYRKYRVKFCINKESWVSKDPKES